MNHRTNDLELAIETPDLRQFTLDFLTRFGATVTPADQDDEDGIYAQLGEELRAHFGVDDLTLSFQHVDQGDGRELVAFGSRVFDRMMSYLARSSALTVQQLPQRFRADEELLHAVRPLNAHVAGLKLAEQSRCYFSFTWHITYRADDKREELYTVVIDEEGQRVPLRVDAASATPSEDEPPSSGFDLAEAMLEGIDLVTGTLAEETADQPAAGPKQPASDQAPATASAFKLPPMTHLARHAEAARKYAIYHADLRCVTHEADILPRLHKTLSRLIGYYQQQIDEVYDAHDPDFAQRRRLEADLERKISEEVENHRLRVGVTLDSYAIFEYPVAVADLTLATAAQTVAVRTLRNLYSGEFQRPTCHACGQEAAEVAIDVAGHLTCAACLHHCATCGDAHCTTCGVDPCPVCGRENCATCSQPCWACGERACADHITRCPTCGDNICLACQQECAACGIQQCTSHLRRDAVTIATQPGEAGGPLFVCRSCAVRCPGCQQFSAQIGTCTASGQRFCRNCLVVCTGCGREVGPGFYERDPLTGAPLCADCLTHCPNCRAVVADTTVCAACHKPCCPSCGGHCEQCRQLFCTDDLATFEPCGHWLCADDVDECHLGGEAICPICTPSCAICSQSHCVEHTSTCSQCRLPYCAACVDEAGLCVTCSAIGQVGEVVALTEEPCVDDRAVAEVAPHYEWRRLRNRHYTIYLGRGMYMSAAVVTVRNTPTGGELIGVRELELDDLLRIKFWRDL
jgi:hypothetical protein